MDSKAQYVLWAISMLFLLYILVGLLKEISSKRYGKEAAVVYSYTAWVTICTWSVYPLIWLFTDYMNILHQAIAVTLYVALDFFSKVVWGVLLLDQAAVSAVLH